MAKKRSKKTVKKSVKRSVASVPRTVKSEYKHGLICPRALGLGFGIVWGLMILFVGLSATYWGYGTQFANLFSTLYPGFVIGVKGSIIGGLWGLVDGFVMGVLIGWFYNRFV